MIKLWLRQQSYNPALGEDAKLQITIQ